MSDLFTEINEVEVSDSEIRTAEALLEGLLKDLYPNLDLREGTGLRDLIIRPGGTSAALLVKAVSSYFNSNTIAGASDSTSEDRLDKIMSNWFVTRKTGDRALVSARIYFASRVNVNIPSTAFFSTDNILRFYPRESFIRPASLLTYDSGSSEYYIDIELQSAKQGAEYNIGSGSLLYFTLFSPFMLRAEINYILQESIPRETNSQLISRSKTAISTRNLINVPSIDYRIREAFPSINRLTTIGMGSIGMNRDLISIITPSSGNTQYVHVGGKVDIFLDTPVSSSPIDIVLDDNGRAEIDGPILKLERIYDTSDTLLEGEPFTYYHKNTLYKAIHTANYLGYVPGNNSEDMVITCLGHNVQVGQYITLKNCTNPIFNRTYYVRRTQGSEVYVDSQGLSGANASTVQFNSSGGIMYYVEPRYDTGFSNKSTLVLDFGAHNAGLTCIMDVFYFNVVSDVQEYLESVDNNVVCGDYISKGYHRYELDIDVVTYTAVEGTANLTKTVDAYLSSLSPGEPFVMADLITSLGTSGVTNIRTPVSVKYSKYVSGLNPPIEGIIQDVLTPHEKNCIFKLRSLTVAKESMPS